MRRALLLIPLLALAGCASTGEKPSAAPSSVDTKGDQVKFAQCMRENGATWFKDPEPGRRGLRLQVPKGTPKEDVDKAMAACKQHLPNGGDLKKLDPQITEKLRKLSRCMRENGVPDFPDPSADGGIQLRNDGRPGGIDPDSPEFKKAEQACESLRPAPPGGEKDSGKRLEEEA